MWPAAGIRFTASRTDYQGVTMGVVDGAVTGAAGGVQKGIDQGSHSTPAAALTLGAIGVAGLVEWPLLLAVGGGALLIRRLNNSHNDGQHIASVTSVKPPPAKSPSSARPRKTPAKRTPARQSSATQSRTRR